MGNCYNYEYTNLTGNLITINGTDCFGGGYSLGVPGFESGETDCIQQLSAQELTDLAFEGMSMGALLPECGTFPDPTPTPTGTPSATNTFTTPTPTPTITPTPTSFGLFFSSTTCNTLIRSDAWAGSGGKGIFTVEVEAAQIGPMTLSFTAYTIPDKFTVTWNGATVIDTGFRGDPSYNSQLNALGYPNVSGSGTGTATFVKSAASPSTVTVVVTAPLNQTAWRGRLGCPIVATPNTGTEISMGCVYNAFGLLPEPGSNIGLSSTLGVNRQPPQALGVSAIPISTETQLSDDFGGLTTLEGYNC